MRSNTSTSRIASMAMRMAPSAAPATRSGTLTLRPTIPLTIIRNTPLIKAPRRYKNCNECDPGLRRWNFRIVREERDGLRRYRHCNANSANVVENRRKAAQQAGHESHDHCDEQTDIHCEVECVGRKEIGHRRWAQRLVGRPCKICLAAIAEKIMNGIAKFADDC